MYAEPWEPWLIRLLTGVELLALPAVLLGYAKHGCPLWPDARALFVPAGAAWLAHALLITGRIDPRYEPLPPINLIATVCFYGLFGLAILGVGANHIHRAAAFRAFALPACACFALYGAAVTVRGSALVPPRMREERAWGRFPRAMGLLTAVVGTLGAAAAVGAIGLSGDDCA